jgi:hypothetical protein
MLLTIGGGVHVVSMVSLHFNGPQWGEEIRSENLKL